ILHRDLKTQNLFVARDGMLVLGDFGVSRPLSSAMDLASTIIGTPYYMSPEVMSNLPYDYKSDLWSLGCCLYEMMSLRHAFDARDMSSLVVKIMRGEHLPIPPQYSPELRELTKNLLARQPKQRPAPEAILKLPWLKDAVSRTRERVARLQASRPPAAPPCPRRHPLPIHSLSSGPSLSPAGPLTRLSAAAPAAGSVVGGAAPPPSRRSLNGSDYGPGPGSRAGGGGGGPGSSSGGVQGSELDDELEAAKERLRMIQAERAALAAARAAGLGGGGPLSGGGWQGGGEAGLGGSGVALWSGGERAAAGLGVPSPPGADWGSGGGGAAGPPGRPPLPPAPPQPQPDPPPQDLDPKSRKEARRQEELRQREAELLEARKAYFAERKAGAGRLEGAGGGQGLGEACYVKGEGTAGIGQWSALCCAACCTAQVAEAKKWQQRHGASGSTAVAMAAAAAAACTPHGGCGPAPSAELQLQGLALAAAEGEALPHRPCPTGPAVLLLLLLQYGRPPPPAHAPFHAHHSSHGEVLGSAAAEFEEELRQRHEQAQQRPPSSSRLASSLRGVGVEGGAVGRAEALREVCHSALGPQLFDLLYGVMRSRLSQQMGDEAVFRQELLARLGPQRMHYLQLIDQLLYYEDQQ
ncbi:hypothetical protein QJQ45_020750, partial [Haematococcus lacustris]